MSLSDYIALAAILVVLVTWAIDKLVLAMPRWIYWAIIVVALTVLVVAGFATLANQLTDNSKPTTPVVSAPTPQGGVTEQGSHTGNNCTGPSANCPTNVYNPPPPKPKHMKGASSSPPKPSLSVTNSPGSIIAPMGGTNTVINEAPSPRAEIVNPLTGTPNADGTFTWTTTFKVDASTPPNSIELFAVKAPVTGFEITGIDTGQMMDRRSYFGDSNQVSYYYFTTPIGRYTATIKTADSTKPKLGVMFNGPRP